MKSKCKQADSTYAGRQLILNEQDYCVNNDADGSIMTCSLSYVLEASEPLLCCDRIIPSDQRETPRPNHIDDNLLGRAILRVQDRHR